MSDTTSSIISVLGTNLLWPTLSLVEKLESLPPKPPNEVQTNPEENGLSCGVITLSALLIESAITRTRYRRSEISKDDQAKYFEKVTSNTELAKDIDEVIAVRDAIVHNHLWEADVDWHP